MCAVEVRVQLVRAFSLRDRDVRHSGVAAPLKCDEVLRARRVNSGREQVAIRHLEERRAPLPLGLKQNRARAQP